jgi:ribosomal protein S18 acetylase RimI-like enzyme
MSLQVRRLGRQDAHLAEQVVRAFKGTSRSAGSLKGFVGHAENYLLVAETATGVCGFLMAYRLDRPDRDASQMFVYEVGVEEPSRGRGVATALVRGITALARDEGMFEAFVLTSKGNARARRLYAGTGGVVEDESAILFVYPLGSGNAA